jgi:hypothetical protein
MIPQHIPVGYRPGPKALPPEWDLDLNPRARFQMLGYHITRVPDVQYPWPPALVKIIRESYDPGFVPIFRKMVYKDTQTGGIFTFCHHGVARYGENTPPDPRIVHCPRPSNGAGADYGPATFVERWFQNSDHVRPGTVRALNNLPPPFIAFTEWVVRWCEETYWESTAAEKAELHQKQEDEAHKQVEKESEEAAYRQKGEAAYQKRLFDQLGPDDEREFLARRAGIYKEDPKPFVHVRRPA